MENAISYSDVLVLNPNPVDLRIKMVQTAQLIRCLVCCKGF